ncbi:MAG: undecaprenyldiphospho-muramoylpentapeptide beta-N-acetylglucosaminyltransferase [Pseudomonadota bacterium]
MSGKPLAILSAGGTGGHVYPALAIAKVLRARGYRLLWIGTRQGIENRLVPEAEINLHHLPMRGFRGKSSWARMQALVLLVVSFVLALGIMLRRRPTFVIGLGGYASLPTSFAAWFAGRTLALQEQNAIPGSANRVLARFAKLIGTGFPDVLATYSQAKHLGNPVRRDLTELNMKHPWSRPEDRPLRILVLGGSLGAKPLNDAVPTIAVALGKDFLWWHQTGDSHFANVQAAVEKIPGFRVSAFIDDMAAAYAWADLVLCRAGALTVAELAVCGRPSILVPLPHAIDDHQTANARYLERAGAARLLPQDRLQDELPALLQQLRSSVALLSAMAEAAESCGRPRADESFVDELEALAA